MKDYDNGTATRMGILAASKKLFYEKGYKETTYDDICRETHVIRSTIHYHFHDKDNIRYEVIMGYARAYQELAEQCGCAKDTSMSVSMYCLWIRYIQDPKFRKFLLDFTIAGPSYSEPSSSARFYQTLYDEMYGRIWDSANIPPIANASVYGYIVGLFQLAAAHPEQYSGRELFFMCQNWGMSIWGIPQKTIEAHNRTIRKEIAKIPVDKIIALPLT